MVTDYIVIDTNIWINALGFRKNPNYFTNCSFIIYSFMQYKECALVLDYDNVIRSEYNDNLNKYRDFQLIFQQLERENRIHRTDGKLSFKVQNDLNRCHFHEPEDQVFVAVAINAGKHIISDDSDYGTRPNKGKCNSEANEYIKSKLGIKLENSDDGVKTMLEMISQMQAHCRLR